MSVWLECAQSYKSTQEPNKSSQKSPIHTQKRALYIPRKEPYTYLYIPKKEPVQTCKRPTCIGCAPRMHAHCNKSAQEPNTSSQKALNVYAKPDTNQQKSHCIGCAVTMHIVYTHPTNVRKRPWSYPQKSPIHICKRAMYVWLFWVCNYNACALTKEPSKSSPKSPIHIRHRPTCVECALTTHAHYYTSTHEPHKCSQKIPKRIYKRARYLSTKEPYVFNVQLECIHYKHTQSIFLLFTHLIKIWRYFWFTSQNTID